MKLLIFLLFLFDLFSADRVDEFVQSLSKTERNELETFLYEIMNSYAGYVIFGDKPLCIESKRNYDDIPVFCGSHLREINGVDFVRKLSNQNANKRFPIISCRDGRNELFFFINREAFLKVVNENLSLFRYALGRTITAESLLNELLHNGDHFYETLKNNKLILGILLGYGTQNSLVGSRQEDLMGELCDNQIIFPYKSYETFTRARKTPSVEFSSVEEECQALLKSLHISTEIKSYEECPIPHFACIADSQETLLLLERYEKNREIILEISKSKDFLNRILARLFVDNSGTFSFTIEKKEKSASAIGKEVFPKLVACLRDELADRIQNSRVIRDDAIKCFLSGVKYQLSGTHIDLEQDFCPDVIESYLTLKRSNRYMDKVSQIPGMIAQVPKYLYCKILTPGKGEVASHIKKATFQFSLYDCKEELLDCGTIKNGETKDLIPGIVHLLAGMKRLEEKVAYIHPKFCYGLLPEASPLKVRIQLIDFELEEGEGVLPQPIELYLRYLEPIDIGALQENPNYFNEGPCLKELDDFFPYIQENKKQLRKSFIKYGYECCENIQRLGVEFDLKTFDQLLRSDKQIFQTPEEKRKFILDFNSLESVD